MIEVGEYVRTNEIIGKVEQIGNSLFWLEDGSSYSLTNKEIKHSKNIIDIIEVGDIVNKVYMSSYMDIYVRFIRDRQDIETILTKEQMEANCYTVERKEK